MPNLFPEGTNFEERQDSQASEVQYGRGWRFDFVKGDFVQSPTGRIIEADEDEAFVQWCQKTLLTPRYRYPIYSRDYGVEYEELIGRDLSREAVESEIRRMTVEALKVDPRTAEVKDFFFNWDGSKVYFSCIVISTRGGVSQIGREVVI